MGTGVRHIDSFKTVHLYEGAASGGVSSVWLDMDLYSHLTIFIGAINGATVTGAAITLKQAQDTLGTAAEALAYSSYFAATGGFTQASTGDVWTQVTGAGGTFTTPTTASTSLMYAIEVQDVDLDLTNAMRTVQLVIGTGSSGVTFYAVAHCYPRYGGNYANMPSVLV